MPVLQFKGVDVELTWEQVQDIFTWTRPGAKTDKDFEEAFLLWYGNEYKKSFGIDPSQVREGRIYNTTYKKPDPVFAAVVIAKEVIVTIDQELFEALSRLGKKDRRRPASDSVEWAIRYLRGVADSLERAIQAKKEKS